MKVLTTAGLTKLIQLCKNAIPTVNNPTITITQGGVVKGSFTLNQATGDTIALDAGGGGSVPDATDQVKGIAKLYNTSGSNTDGSMTQSAITNEIINSVNTREISEGNWIDIWFSSYWSGTRVYLEDIKNQSSTTYATYLSTLSDLYTNRSATMATLKIPYNSGRTCYLYLVDNNEYYFFLPKDGKRLRVYDDNGTIKFEEAMFKDFALMSDLPTVYNPTITITQGGVTKGSFTLNQSSGDTIALDAGGAGSGDVEWAIYGTTTHQQISDWANAGKEVLVKNINGVTIYRLVHADVSEHIFTTANLKAISYCYVTSQNVWYSSANNLQVEIPAGTAGNVITYTGTAGSIGSATLATVATSGDYNDLINKPTIPTVNDSTITITQGGVTKGSFTLNQASGDTIALDAGGVTAFQAPTAQNNYIWYRKYADGWVEQGGTLTYTARQSVYSTITLPIQMADNHYTLVSEPGYTARSDTTTGQHVASRNGLKTTTTIFIAAYGNGADDLTDYIDWQVSGMYAQ